MHFRTVLKRIHLLIMSYYFPGLCFCILAASYSSATTKILSVTKYFLPIASVQYRDKNHELYHISGNESLLDSPIMKF